jgi:anti-sigma factor RsiW
VKPDTKNERPLTAYLLGNLNPDEQQRLEQRLWIDSSVLDELERAEDELIDNYLEGALSGSEQEKFENCFLAAPERQRKLRFAKALKRYVATHGMAASRWNVWRDSWAAFRRFQNPILNWSLAAALLLIVAGGSWAALRIFRLQTALEQAMTPSAQKLLLEERARNSELRIVLQNEQDRRSLLEKQLAKLNAGERPETSQPVLFACALNSGLLRDVGSSIQKLRIPRGTDLAQLTLNSAPDNYRRYQAVLQSVGGNEVCTQIFPKAKSAENNQPLRLILPAKPLIPGDYVLILSGTQSGEDFEEIGKYYFRVIQN